MSIGEWLGALPMGLKAIIGAGLLVGYVALLVFAAALENTGGPE